MVGVFSLLLRCSLALKLDLSLATETKKKEYSKKSPLSSSLSIRPLFPIQLKYLVLKRIRNSFEHCFFFEPGRLLSRWA